MQDNQIIYDRKAYNYDIYYDFMEKMFKKGRKLYSKLNGKILEIGVGTGNNLLFYDNSARIYGIDWSKNMILQAKRKVKRLKIKNIQNLQVGDVQKLSQIFPENFFDYITSTCVFCSVPDPIIGLREIKKVLKENGYLVQMEHGISKNKLINKIMHVIDTITFNKLGFHITRNHIKNLEKAGFEIIKYTEIDPLGIVKIIISKKKQ